MDMIVLIKMAFEIKINESYYIEGGKPNVSWK